jgi:hypothetical protein
MHERILREIRRLAKESEGKPPGSRLFEQQTGIRVAAWRGVYWARWGDAVTDAGLTPNLLKTKIDEQFLLVQIAEACRQLGKIPTAMDLRIYRRTHSDFPNRAMLRHFQLTANMLRRLAEWTRENESYADVAAKLAGRLQAKKLSMILTRICFGFCLALCGFALSIGANAQQSNDIATDQELFAGYCFGVTQATATSFSKNKLSDLPELDEIEKSTKETLAREVSKFQGYLAARGILTGARSASVVSGVLMAKNRGLNDAARCFAQIDTCVAKCTSNKPYVQKCVTDCRDEENACRSMARCGQEDRLPF